MTRRTLLALLALVIAGVYWWSFRAPPGDRGVSDALGARVAAAEGSIIDLADVAPFAWTRFCAFPPYSGEGQASRLLGFRWPYRWSAVRERDDRYFLVFVDGDDVVSAFDHPLTRGGFDPVYAYCYTREEARFSVAQEGEMSRGGPYYVLRPAR